MSNNVPRDRKVGEREGREGEKILMQMERVFVSSRNKKREKN